MSVSVVNVDGKYRLVENGTRKLAVTKNGVPVDGGGHNDVEKAQRQALHLNTSKPREPDSGRRDN